MVLPQLKQLAQTLGLKGTGAMRKGQLIDAIRAAQNGSSGRAEPAQRQPAQREPVQHEPIQHQPAERGSSPSRGPNRRSRGQRAQLTKPTAASRNNASRSPRPRPAGRFSRPGDSRKVTPSLRPPSLRPPSLRPTVRSTSVATIASVTTGSQNSNRDGGQYERRNRRSNGGGPNSGNQGNNIQQLTRDNQQRDGQRDGQQQRDGQPVTTSTRDNQQQRDNQQRDNQQQQRDNQGPNRDFDDDGGSRRGRRRRSRDRQTRRTRTGSPSLERFDVDPVVSEDDVLDPANGILDVLDNYAFVRTSGYLPGPDDAYVSLAMVKKFGLRKGDVVNGVIRASKDGDRREKFNPLVRIDLINGRDPEQAKNRPDFAKLTPLYPQERLKLETHPNQLIGRIIDLVCPVGKGQRGLIVFPSKAGKTMIMQADGRGRVAIRLARAATGGTRSCRTDGAGTDGLC